MNKTQKDNKAMLIADSVNNASPIDLIRIVFGDRVETNNMQLMLTNATMDIGSNRIKKTALILRDSSYSFSIIFTGSGTLSQS